MFYMGIWGMWVKISTFLGRSPYCCFANRSLRSILPESTDKSYNLRRRRMCFWEVCYLPWPRISILCCFVGIMTLHNLFETKTASQQKGVGRVFPPLGTFFTISRASCSLYGGMLTYCHYSFHISYIIYHIPYIDIYYEVMILWYCLHNIYIYIIWYIYICILFHWQIIRFLGPFNRISQVKVFNS